MSNRAPTLGDKVRCKITNFEGVITSHATHLTGCDRFWVQPTVGEDGKPRDGQWIDIDLLEITTPNAHERTIYLRATPGGVDLPAPR